MPDVPLSSLTPLSMLPSNAEILVSVTGSDGRPTFARLDPLALVTVPNGTISEGGTLLSNKYLGPLVSSWNGSGIRGVDISNGLIMGRYNTAGPTNVNDLLIQRDANYAGGTFGYVNSAARFATYARAGTKSFENASVSILENYTTAADNTQNVAHISHTNVRGTGGSWAGVSELDDYGAADPTTPRVAHEFDLFSNGTDANSNRVIVDSVGAKLNASGAITQIGWGFRFQNSLEGAAGSYFEVGYGAGTAAHPVPVRVLVDGLYAVAPSGSSNPVTALRMASGQIVDFKGDRSRTLTYSASALTYSVGGATGMQMSDTGVLTVGALGSTSGAQLLMVGNGAVTPNKSIRVTSGVMQFVNSAYSGVIASLTDVGTLDAAALSEGGTLLSAKYAGLSSPTFTSGIGVWGHTPPATQPARAVTLADVIAVLAAAGLTA